MIKDTDTFAMFARMRSVDAIVRSALSKKQFVSSSSRENEDNEDVDKIKAAAMDELQRTALRLLSLLENKGTKFHEKLCTITLDDGDDLDDVEKKKYADKTRRDYIDVFLKKIFLKAEESGCLRDDFAEKHAERLLAAASLASETERREDGGDEGNAMTMTKKMFVYENGTIQETGETFDEAPFDEGDSPYENLSEITLSLSTNLFAGNTGAHEWTAGFKLAELAINEPGLVYNKTVLELGSGAGLAAVAMLRSQPLRLVLTDKCKESNDNLEKNVRENIFSGIGSSNSSSSSSSSNGTGEASARSSMKGKITVKRENALDALPPMPTGDDVYRKDALASKNRTEEEEMAFTYECENIDSFVSIRELDWFSDEETLKAAADAIDPDLIVASDVGYDPDLLPGLIDTLDTFLRKRSSSRNYMWLEPETSEDAFDMLFSPRPSEVAKPCVALIVNARRQEETNAKFDQLLKEKEHLVSFDVTEFALLEKAFLGFDSEQGCLSSSPAEEERRDDVVVRVIFASSLPSVRYAKREGSKKNEPGHAVVSRGRYVFDE
jgi:predicted nicotinamide N-methyase